MKYINLQNENGLIFRIMCNEKQWSTWIHHILGLFVDKWEAARGNKKTKRLCAPTGALYVISQARQTNLVYFHSATLSQQSF